MPVTEPPGQAEGSAQVYWMIPSCIVADGTATVWLVASARRLPSKFANRYSRSFLIGPPSDAPKVFRISFGALLHDGSLSGVPLLTQFCCSPLFTKKSLALV